MCTRLLIEVKVLPPACLLTTDRVTEGLTFESARSLVESVAPTPIRFAVLLMFDDVEALLLILVLVTDIRRLFIAGMRTPRLLAIPDV